MYPFVKNFHVSYNSRTSISYLSNLVDICFLSKSLKCTKFVHALLIKVGLNSHTFLGNRCLDLYSQFGTLDDASKVFDEIAHKNLISWNVYLKAFLRHGELDRARCLFDDMPERDVVSWNSMISGHAFLGNVDRAFSVFQEMRRKGIRPSGFTYSILMSYAPCVRYGKQIHGGVLRSVLNLSNVVLGNSLVDMYGKFGLVDYAFGVFLTMEKVDIVSWNSLISVCYKSGYTELAFNQFCQMISVGQLPDEFTLSTVIAACSRLGDLRMGEQIFSCCVKTGYLSNAIVSSAIIDLFSKCNRLEDSVSVFEEHNRWDSAIFDAMISIYSRHGFGNNALQLLIYAMREGLSPGEFSLTGVLSSVPSIVVEQGSQVHSLVVKTGLDSDPVLASSLMEMYTKFGLVDSALEIFYEITVKDLISWNTLIVGLARNGRIVEAMNIFQEILREVPMPDGITLLGVLLACDYGGLVDKGLQIFSSMENKYGIKPALEHYACIVSLLSRVGRIKEAVDIVQTMPYEHSSVILETILETVESLGDLNLTESVSGKLMELDPQSPLPYVALVHAYEMRGKWESVARIKRSMRDKGVKRMVGSSWLGTKNHVISFKEDELQYHGGEDVYMILRLLLWQMGIEGYINTEKR